MPVYEVRARQHVPWRQRPTWQWVVMILALVVFSPLIVLAALVAVSPWGLGSIAAVVLLWAAVHTIRRRTGTLPGEQREDRP